jgi:hypothetical protein
MVVKAALARDASLLAICHVEGLPTLKIRKAYKGIEE